MKFDPFLSDEPAIAPPTPGALLVRLSQVIGALRDETFGPLLDAALRSRAGSDAAPKASSVPSIGEKLASARAALLHALEKGEALGEVFAAGQHVLRELYALVTLVEGDAERSHALARLGFPEAQLLQTQGVLAVDLSTLVLTHFKPQRQVFSTLTFTEAHGATAYWLLEVLYVDGQRVVDGVVENYAPQFSRVRMPIGTHHLIIESRNPHHSARTAEFSIEVPRL